MKGPSIEWVKRALEHLKEDCTSASLLNIVSKDSVRGTRQDSDCRYFTHEYVDQREGPCGDDYYGTIFLPLPNGEYMAFNFCA